MGYHVSVLFVLVSMKVDVSIPLTVVFHGTELPHVELEDQWCYIC